MKIIGYLGSPRVNGLTGKIMKKILEGAESKGAETKKIDLIKCNIEHCRGCYKCYHHEPELPIGKCPQKDDMAELLEEYINADGYILGSPVYDVSSTAIMKKFTERKLALNYRPKDAYAMLGTNRSPAEFKKSAILLATANCTDDYKDSMGAGCFEVMEMHLMLEQIDVMEKYYVGGVETFTDEDLKIKFDYAFNLGVRFVEELGTLNQA